MSIQRAIKETKDMSVEFFWRLPTHGDGRKPHDQHTRGEWNKTPPERRIAPGVRNGREDGFGYIDYLSQVARAAEINGFDGVLVPTGPGGEQSWIVATALARETRKLRFLIAHQAAFATPQFTAQISATLQRITHGRVDINFITGGSSKSQRAIGDFLDHDARYARSDEFLEVFQGYWNSQNYNHQGALYQFEEGGLGGPLARATIPGIYFVGSSDPAIDVAARRSDVYLVWAEPLKGNQEVFDKVRRRAEEVGRKGKVRFGVRVDIIARPTEKEAWDEARRLFALAAGGGSPLGGDIANPPALKESAGAVRQWELHKGNRSNFDDLIVGPNLWAGMSILRGGPACGLIGSYEQIADRLAEYIDIGASSFILASNPHLEEAYSVGEEVLPRIGEAVESLKQRQRAA
jgi:alkanesulfonate monooxygenase